MLNDSGIEIEEEFLASFLEESEVVLKNCHELVENFKGPQDTKNFEQYGQQIDRIMGAAYTLSLNEVGDLAKLGKELGYKSSQIDDVAKLLTIQSLLSQLVRTLGTIMKGFRKGHRPDPEDLKPLLNKLNLASTQLGNLRSTLRD